MGCLLNNTSSPFWSFVSLFSSPSLTLLCLSILDTHTHTLLFSVLPHSMSYCSFLRVSTFYSRPLGLLLPLLFSELWLLLHIKQERCPVMWPDVPRLPYTTLCAACVGWIGQCLPRPLGPRSDPAALRERFAVDAVTHRKVSQRRIWCFKLQNST